jgi:hypothetical protein
MLVQGKHYKTMDTCYAECVMSLAIYIQAMIQTYPKPKLLLFILHPTPSYKVSNTFLKDSLMNEADSNTYPIPVLSIPNLLYQFGINLVI